MTPRIFVAGPYNAPTPWEREQNIREAEAVALSVLQLGGAPVCPHTMARHWFGAIPEEVAIRWCDTLLLGCDGVVFLPSWRMSPGTRREYQLAIEWQTPRFILRSQEQRTSLAGWIRQVAEEAAP